MMKIIVLLYLLFNSLAFVMNQNMRTTQEFFFQMSSLVLILSSLVFQPKQKKESLFENKLNISILVMFAWFLCVFLKDKMGWSILLNTFLGIGVYLTVIRNLDYKDIKFAIKNSMWIAAFCIGYNILQYMGFDLRGQTVAGTSNMIPKCSIFGLEAHYGMYLAMMFPLFLGISFVNRDMGQKWQRLSIIVGILVLIGLMFLAIIPAHSTGAYLGLLAAILVYLWHRVRVAFWVVLLPVFIGAILFLVKIDGPMGMQFSRLDLWKKVVQDSHQRPFGYGLDSFRNDEREGALRYFKYAHNDTTIRLKKVGVDWFMQSKPEKELLDNIEKVNNGTPTGTTNFWDNPHSEPIQLLYETGFPGIIIFGFILYFLYQIFKFSMRKPLTVACYASLICIAIFNCVQFGFHVARIGHIIPIILGMFIVSARDE